MLTFERLINFATERKASDLHLIPGYYPTLRVNKEINQIKIFDIVSEIDTQAIVNQLTNEQQKEKIRTNKELDFSYQYGQYRLRINCYYAKGYLSIAFRILDSRIRSIEELNLPSFFYNFVQYPQGVVIITGPTGEGKSTTLASLINYINLTQAKHIITIEDPIEYVYPQGKSIISQRELYVDTNSFPTALRSALREDPDIVLVGEMRDYESISLVLTLAETGHLVFSTLHTSDTPEAINRIIDIFPSSQQNQIRNQLASNLKAIIAQRLLPSLNNQLMPAVEVLLNIPAVAENIREGNLQKIPNILLSTEKEGLIIFEKYLKRMVDQNIITKETAYNHAFRPNYLLKLLS